MVQRLAYRRRNAYRTASNRVRVVKTPGGKLTYLYARKKAQATKCGDCGCELNGLATVRPYKLHSLPKNRKTVTRAYGGSRCAECVRNRIVRAFLVEEQKIVKKVMKTKAAEEVVAEKAAPKK